jgi:ferredoxin--NADP+ reductase
MNDTNAKVVQRIEVSPALLVLRVAPDDWTMSEFTPGQFAVLGLPGSSARCSLCEPEDDPSPAERIIKRAYSISSSSRVREFLEFYIALVPSGALTPRLFNLNVGDAVWVGPKFSGLFTLREVPRDKHVVLVSTGTGLAPYVSMLRDQLQCGGPQQFAVIHGARHSWELGYRSELMMLESMCPNMIYLPVVSRPEREPVPWAGSAGRIQEVWKQDALRDRWGFNPSPDNSHVFLCGNPGMVEELAEILAADGFVEHSSKQQGQVHVERYW